MLNWVLQHRAELVTLAWIANAIVFIPVVLALLERWRYQRQFRRHLRMSAHIQARYAVFDSWVRSGGAVGVLGENVRNSILSDYRMAAKKHGEEYFAVFEAAEQDAMRDLQAVVKIVKGAENEEKA